jgi:hypothetical protein
MKLKKVLVSASLIGISVTALPVNAEEEKLQTKSMSMMQQANAFAEKEGRNIDYSDMNQVGKQEKPKYQYRYREDNETGKGEKIRTRTRTQSAFASQTAASTGKHKSMAGHR